MIAENVKGLLIGEAKSYVTKIHDSFEEAGYYCQHFLVNGKYMGVPQNRERVFFVCIRKDIAEPLLYQASLFERLPKFELNFNEEPIPFKDVADGSGDEVNSPKMRQCWDAELMAMRTCQVQMKDFSTNVRCSTTNTFTLKRSV